MVLRLDHCRRHRRCRDRHVCLLQASARNRKGHHLASRKTLPTIFLLFVFASAFWLNAQDDAPLTPREKALLERIEKLEQRIDALESEKSAANGQHVTAVPATQPPAPTVTAATPAETQPVNVIKTHVKAYGRVEMDATYSSRGTNPLDPRQFNGYATAAGPENTSSSTFNPRFSVIGLEAGAQKGDQSLDAKVEVDFYSTDSANLITPRLRLAYVEYARKDTKATVGMDWLPVASLLPDLMDFSIMGYGGNLWQRLPQATVRQKFGKHWEVLGTAFRFERGFTLQPAPFVHDPFTDPVKMPYIGTRIAYQNWGAGNSGLVAVSGAYRQFAYPTNGRTVRSDVIALELAVPISEKLHWNSKIAHGQGLGDEFFRFGQAYNGDIPIKTTAGWTELTYSPVRRVTFASGFGLDNPLGKDLIGISNNNLNYHRNARYYVNGVFDLFENVKFSLELNYLHTNWTNGDMFTAYQPMASVFYTF